ncbi:protein S100-P-like [Discoglossus pictus]
MTELETAMVMIINVFDRYACAEGCKKTLNKGELKTLLEKELPGILANCKDKDAQDKIMKDLDEDTDGAVSFKEFTILVATLTILGHEVSGKTPPKK